MIDLACEINLKVVLVLELVTCGPDRCHPSTMMASKSFLFSFLTKDLAPLIPTTLDTGSRLSPSVGTISCPPSLDPVSMRVQWESGKRLEDGYRK